MQIYCKITGNDPVRLEPQVEERVKLMFAQIQEPFIRHRPPKRKNFLSYPYVMFKFMQLLGLPHMLVHLTLLKGETVLCVQEGIWSNICNDLGWEFIAVPLSSVVHVDDEDE
jgi:hypothetical protein